MTFLNNKGYLKSTRKELRNNATETEKILWNYLQRSKLEGYKFRRQHSIGRYIVDFYCPKLHLSIELDGEIHASQKEYDEIRTIYLESFGIKELRFSNNDILKNIDGTLEKIKNYIHNHS